MSEKSKLLPVQLGVLEEVLESWEMEACAAGMTVEQWVIEKACESMTEALSIQIPKWASFPDLKLRYDREGRLEFNVDPVRGVCDHNSVPVDDILGDKDRLYELLKGWYEIHLKWGGQRNPIAEDFFATLDILSERSSAQYLPAARA